MNEFLKWEKIEAATWRTGSTGSTATDNIQILRLEVPGGWIYMVNGGPVFVPRPEIHHFDANDQLVGYEVRGPIDDQAAKK